MINRASVMKNESINSQFGLYQLINELTYILQSSSSCIDLILTSQSNIAVESVVHSSIHPNCHHELAFAHCNLKIGYLPPYSRELWHYKEANAYLIKRAISNFNWSTGKRLFLTIILINKFLFSVRRSITVICMKR